MKVLILAACLVTVVTLAGCSPGTSEDRIGCDGGTARVSASRADDMTWETELPRPTEEPPIIDKGYVLVRHACGYSVLDLTDGEVVRTGDDTGTVGIAAGFLYAVTHDGDDTTVAAQPVIGKEVAGVQRATAVYVGDPDVSAHIAGDIVYIVNGQNIEQHGKLGGLHWQVQLPVLQEPTIADADQVVVVTSADGSVYGLAKSDGRPLWRTVMPNAAAHYELTTRVASQRVPGGPPAKPGAAEVTIASNTGTFTVVELRTRDGKIVHITTAPSEPPSKGPAPLVASGDGWLVTIDSDPVPRPMAG